MEAAIDVLKSKLFQALGEASVCWMKPPESLFDSSRCNLVGEKLWKEIEFFMTTTPGALQRIRGGTGTFGDAIAAAKAGYKVARKGWNGSGMYAYYVPGGNYASQTEHAKKEFGETTPYRPYWALKTAQNDVATWAPSGSDSLADDWMIVE